MRAYHYSLSEVHSNYDFNESLNAFCLWVVYKQHVKYKYLILIIIQF